MEYCWGSYNTEVVGIVTLSGYLQTGVSPGLGSGDDFGVTPIPTPE